MSNPRNQQKLRQNFTCEIFDAFNMFHAILYREKTRERKICINTFAIEFSSDIRNNSKKSSKIDKIRHFHIRDILCQRKNNVCFLFFKRVLKCIALFSINLIVHNDQKSQENSKINIHFIHLKTFVIAFRKSIRKKVLDVSIVPCIVYYYGDLHP